MRQPQISRFIDRFINALVPHTDNDKELADLIEEARCIKADLSNQADSLAQQDVQFFRLQLRRALNENKLRALPDAEKAAQVLESIFSQVIVSNGK